MSEFVGFVGVWGVRGVEVPSFRGRPRPRLTPPDDEVVDATRGVDVACLRGRPGPRLFFTVSSEDGVEGTSGNTGAVVWISVDPLRGRNADGTV